MTLAWPAAILIMFLVFVALVAEGEPRRRRHELQLAQVKAAGRDRLEP